MPLIVISICCARDSDFSVAIVMKHTLSFAGLSSIPWFTECHDILEVAAGAQMSAYEATMRVCQEDSAPTVLRQIFDLEERGCSVPLPQGVVPSATTVMEDREACSDDGAPVPIVLCSASSEYNEHYGCVFDAGHPVKFDDQTCPSQSAPSFPVHCILICCCYLHATRSTTQILLAVVRTPTTEWSVIFITAVAAAKVAALGLSPVRRKERTERPSPPGST